MRSRLLASALTLVAVIASSPGAPAREAAVQHWNLPAAGSLLALKGDRLLAWGDDGRANVRRADGTWTDEFQLPVKSVWTIVPDGSGFLLSGDAGPGQHVVILLDAGAVERQRWVLPKSLADLFVDGGRRWAVQRTGLTELLPGGALGPLELFSDADAIRRHYRVPTVFESDGSRWLCWGADLTEAHDAPASCQRAGGEKWYLPGAGQHPPIHCGGWLIEHVGREQKELGVWSLQGKLVARRHYPSIPVVACAGDDAVVVGSRRIEIGELPSLRPRWTHPARGRPVSAVAAVRDQVFYTTEGSTDVVGVRR